MRCGEVVFSVHAVKRMFFRGIRKTDVSSAVEAGEVIADYPDDRPYPSVLILGHAGTLPIHVVVAYYQDMSRCIVVTVYVPDPGAWRPDLRRRWKT
jgi:hypothetical protein